MYVRVHRSKMLYTPCLLVSYYSLFGAIVSSPSGAHENERGLSCSGHLMWQRQGGSDNGQGWGR